MGALQCAERAGREWKGLKKSLMLHNRMLFLNTIIIVLVTGS
jgi:hypothetical protein